jgi:hypothetical protein
MLKRIAAAMAAGSLGERLGALERAVRKLTETDRDRMASVEAKLADLGRAVGEQPTAKDLREVRQALRGLTDRQPDRRLLDPIEQAAASGKRLLIGPWTGEVGFELLYWIPFLRWARAQWHISPDREVIVSRGGVASWYGQDDAHYVDIFDMFAPDEFRAAVAEEKRKRRRPGEFEDQVTKTVMERLGADDVEVVHPGAMYRLFDAYWRDEAGYGRLDEFTRHQRLEPPVSMKPAGLPTNYTAVRFYFNECFPETPENRAFARNVIASIAERSPVVLLNPGFTVDDHTDWLPDGRERIVAIDDHVTPATNLAVQSAVIAGARAFIGTYGGYSYLAPLYGVSALAFYSKPTFKQHHLYAAQRAFADIHAGPLVPINVANVGVVQLALGAMVPA